MPIRVSCPSCEATVAAPDNKAGQKVNCPKCASMMMLPGKPTAEYEVVDEAAPRLPKRPPRLDDEPPRKRKKSKAGGGIPVWVIVVGLGLLFLLLIVGMAIVWLLLPKPPAPPAKPGTPAPVVSKPEVPKLKWSEMIAPDDSFEAAFPGGKPQMGATPDVALPNIQGLGGAKNASDLGIAVGQWSRTEATNLYSIQFVEMPAIVAKSVSPTRGLENAKVGKQPDGTEITIVEAVTVGGHPGQRVVKKFGSRRIDTRIVTVKSRTFTVTAGMIGDADEAIAKEFFDRFIIKNVPDPKPLPGLEGFGGSLDDIFKQLVPPEPGPKKP